MGLKADATEDEVKAATFIDNIIHYVTDINPNDAVDAENSDSKTYVYISEIQVYLVGDVESPIMYGPGVETVKTDPVTGEKYVPYVIEPSLGADRVVLAFLCNAYEEEEIDGDTRVVLKLHHALAPYKVAVLPLQKKALGEKSEEIYRMLSKRFSATYDESASIGKRYRRQDEIGTPYCVTIDFDTLDTDTVTVRERDSMAQVRIPIDSLVKYLEDNLQY